MLLYDDDISSWTPARDYIAGLVASLPRPICLFASPRRDKLWRHHSLLWTSMFTQLMPLRV